MECLFGIGKSAVEMWVAPAKKRMLVRSMLRIQGSCGFYTSWLQSAPKHLTTCFIEVGQLSMNACLTWKVCCEDAPGPAHRERNLCNILLIVSSIRKGLGILGRLEAFRNSYWPRPAGIVTTIVNA